MIGRISVGLLIVQLLGCSQNGSPVHFVIPDGYLGEIRLVQDAEDGISIAPEGKRFVIRVPANGVLRVKSFDRLQAMHVQSAAYQNGTIIPNGHDAWRGPNGEAPTLSKDVVVFSGGGLSQTNDEPPAVTYFVGSSVDYEAWQVKRSQHR